LSPTQLRNERTSRNGAGVAPSPLQLGLSRQKKIHEAAQEIEKDNQKNPNEPIVIAQVTISNAGDQGPEPKGKPENANEAKDDDKKGGGSN
jgi:hypothetical protein